MRLLALIGSPRKKSNTDILVDRVLNGAEDGGHSTEKIYLYTYEISPCIDCRKCKKGDGVCAIKDDMHKIYPLINEAGGIVFGTPNYWYGPTAKMKLLIDRMRPYVTNGKLKGKKAFVVTPAAEGPDACGPMIDMFRMSFDYLEMEFAGKVLAKAYERGEIGGDQETLANAYHIGASL